MDSAGNMVVGDGNNNRVRVIAASTGSFYGQAMTKGDIYTIAGNGTRSSFSGAGGPATERRTRRAERVAVDGAGNLVIADTDNNRIRVVADTAGNLVIADTENSRIRVVAGSTGTLLRETDDRQGDIYTVAGERHPGIRR